VKLGLLNLNKLWVGIILTLVLVLPIQIYFNSPLPVLIPYFLFFFLILLPKKSKTKSYHRSLLQIKLEIIIIIYSILVLFHFTWQIFFSVSTIADLLSSLVIYFFSTFFFFYLKNNLTYETFKVILFGILLSGIIVGVYFIYDSYQQLLLGKISNYSILVNEYEQFRKNSADINSARLKSFERAYGLLETHSVSSAWVSFGCFSALTLIKSESYIKRNIVIFITLMVLFCGLNFTGILAFIFSIVLIEFNIFKIFKYKVSLFGLKQIFFLCIFLFTTLIFIYFLLPIENQSLVMNLLNYFPQLLSGDLITREDNRTYLQGLYDSVLNYPNLMFNYFPIGLLIGDGFSTNFGLNKGGDYGIVESIYRFGIPFFFIFFISIFRLVFSLFSKMNNNGNNNITKFCTFVLVYILFSEFHYSIWNSKSVLALLFIVFAVIYRHKNILNNSLE
jgi:hypothetical protein